MNWNINDKRKLGVSGSARLLRLPHSCRRCESSARSFLHLCAHINSSNESMENTQPSCNATLPPELLAHIFEMGETKSSLISGNMPIWIVSRVCQQWHAVALSLPKLWAHIVIEDENEDETLRIPDSLVERLQLCLQRSQSCHLHLELIGSDRLVEFSYDGIGAIVFSTLFRQAFRFRRLTAYLEALRYLVKDDAGLPALTHFQLLPYPNAEGIRSELRFLRRAPNLKSLDLDTANIGSLTWLQIPIHQVTRCTIMVDLPVLATLRLDQMQHFTFRFPWSDPDSDFHDQIHFPVLHTLEIDNDGGTDDPLESPFFSLLSCPSLQQLILRGITITAPDRADDLCTLLHQCHQSLTSLTISWCYLEPYALERIFIAAPFLKVVQLEYADSEHDGLHGIVLEKLQTAELLPHLEELSFASMLYEDRFDSFPLLSFLNARTCPTQTPSSSRLKKVALETPMHDTRLSPLPNGYIHDADQIMARLGVDFSWTRRQRGA